MKMNTLLATTEHKASSCNKMIADYSVFFKDKQGSFKGSKKTFSPREGFVDQPNMRESKQVVTTVDEKFEWFGQNLIPYLNDLFSIEATNSIGAAKVELKVGDKSFGMLSALELMRLKNFLTNTNLDKVYQNIPVREDKEVWKLSTDSEYSGRKVYENLMITGVTKTTTKRQEILSDPNIDKLKDSSRYTPMVTTIDTVETTGDYTAQIFSGEWSQRERAELLRRKSELLGAVIKALKEVNDIESVKSDLDSEALINYLHFGK